MSLTVTSVRIFPGQNGDEQLLAYASVQLEDEFIVHNIRLVKSEEGVIVAMPNEKYGDSYRDIAHPISSECREQIKRALLEAYNSHEDVGETDAPARNATG